MLAFCSFCVFNHIFNIQFIFYTGYVCCCQNPSNHPLPISLISIFLMEDAKINCISDHTRNKGKGEISWDKLQIQEHYADRAVSKWVRKWVDVQASISFKEKWFLVLFYKISVLQFPYFKGSERVMCSCLSVNTSAAAFQADSASFQAVDSGSPAY